MVYEKEGVDMNVKEVKENVFEYIKRCDRGESFTIPQVCDDCGIFDWFDDRIGRTKFQEMYSFLNAAEKLGYTGYCCFKVGSSFTANGMWAYKNESTTGYSPDGGFIYRSFSPNYTEWGMRNDDGELLVNMQTGDTSFAKKNTMLARAKELGWL